MRQAPLFRNVPLGAGTTPRLPAHLVAAGRYRLVAASEADAKCAATRETAPSARQRRYSVNFGENHHDDVF
jgi:hypothetical protein